MKIINTKVWKSNARGILFRGVSGNAMPFHDVAYVAVPS